jgi:amidase
MSTTKDSRAMTSTQHPDTARTTRTPEPRTTGTLGFNSAVELARMIRDKEISSLELTRYFIGRIERLDGDVNAIVVRDFDRALDAARKADTALARGEATGPLHGLPMTIKEGYNVAGLATTWGVRSYQDNIASTDAAVVKSFRAAGAHFLGKSNVPFMLGDFQSYNEIFGTTSNPWDTTRGPGGSSGGSAAALAAGLTGLESGSDIGGSIRNPAHFCGVYGHKPTWGIVPRQGHELPSVPVASDMAVVGPLARSAEDLAVALDLVAGADPLNAPGWRLELPAPRRTSLRGLRVAVWPSDESSPVDDEISDRVQQVAELLARRGAVVSDRARPSFDPAGCRRTYVALVNAIVGAGAPDAMYEENKRRAAELDPGDTSKPAVIARTLVLDHRAWLRCDAERTRLREQWKSFFEDWDILLCPIMATTAFHHDHRPVAERTLAVNGADQPYFAQVFWSSLATVAYLPATVFPSGLSRGGLPIGLQAIGAEFADHTTIEFARLMAEEQGGFVPPPGFAD